jgi:carbamoyl-phosphate synthase large subunit
LRWALRWVRPGTAAALSAAGLDVRVVNKVAEGRPHIVDAIKNDEASLIINTTEGRRAIMDSAPIRASAEQHNVFYTTTLAAAEAVCLSLSKPKMTRSPIAGPA